MIANPYIVGSPLKPAFFFGRQREVRIFFNTIGARQIQSLSLMGLRRSGKTSFLSYVADQPVVKRHLREQADQYLLVLLDMQHNITRPADFYAEAVHQLAIAANIAPPLSQDAATQLSHLETILDQVAPRKVALLLDEFDLLAHYPSFNVEFFNGLRSLITGYLGRFALVTATYHSLFELGQQYESYTSPLFNVFSLLHLGAFAATEIEELIHMPAQDAGHPFSSDEGRWLARLAGGLPAFIQKAAWSLFEAHLGDEDLDDQSIRDQVEKDFVEWANAQFTYYWDHFTDEERHILSLLATGTSAEQADYIQRRGRGKLENLVNYGLVTSSDTGYTINGEGLARWIRQIAIQLGGQSTSSSSLMLSAEEVEEYQQLLKIHRRNVGHCLKQRAQLGPLTPAHVIHELSNNRQEIRRVKTILRRGGVEVANHPDDEPPSSDGDRS